MVPQPARSIRRLVYSGRGQSCQPSEAIALLPTSHEFWITVGAMCAGLGLTGSMAWLERRPRRSLDPRLVPTTLLMFVGVTIFVLALVHLLNIEGIHTGRR